MERAAEVLWVTNHMEDLESDFSAIHRVDEMLELPSVKFFKFASRIFAYEGVMAARAEEQRRKPGRGNASNRHVSTSTTNKAGAGERKTVPVRSLASMANGEVKRLK